MTASNEPENSARREALLRKLKQLHEVNSKAPPVVELDQYFIGNTDEESIAPIAWADGRPTISDSEIYRVLSEIRARPDVSAVLVGLHFDCGDAERFGGRPAAENVHIFSTAKQTKEVASSRLVGPFVACHCRPPRRPSANEHLRGLRELTQDSTNVECNAAR